MDKLIDTIQHQSLEIRPLILKTFQAADIKLIVDIDNIYIKILSFEILAKTAEIIYTELYDFITLKTRNSTLSNEWNFKDDIIKYMEEEEFTQGEG